MDCTHQAPSIQGILQAMEPVSPVSPALAGGFFTTRATWEVHSFSLGFVKILLFLLMMEKKSPFPNPPPQAWKFKITVRYQYPSTREKWWVWSGQCSGSRWPQQLTKRHSSARSSTCCHVDLMASCQNWMLEPGWQMEKCHWLKNMFSPKINRKWKSLTRVWHFAAPLTMQSMEFSRPEYWRG